MKKSWAGLTAALVVCSFFSACEGPAGADGAPGPAGPAGPAGPMGVPGAEGAAGAQGDAGLAGLDGMDGMDGTNGIDGRTPQLQLLDSRVRGWVPANRTALDNLMTNYGRSSSGYDPAERPVAIFDWDNTVLKNDIGDATFFWMLKHDKILRPSTWPASNPNLSDAGVDTLSTACDSLAAVGQPLPTSTNNGCSDALYRAYVDGTAADGGAAWNNPVTLTNNNQYAWVSQLTAGYRPDEVRAFGRAAFDENNSADLGTTQTVGGVSGVTGYVRIYDQIRDLIGALQANGFDVWVLTASPQYVVDAIADEVGVRRDHVIGIRPMIVGGKITATFQGCGAAADGNTTMITFDEGKRCWINKVIFHVPSSTQAQRQTDARKKPAFVAGDSDTDIGMLKEATRLKLVINRNKVQLMCNGIANAGNSWLVQPMFISPKAPKTSPYLCSSATDASGARIVDENGNVFPADLTEANVPVEAP